jgi:ankyrin repeat protein/Cdc6-like AAA superfamily ATPase
VKNDARKQTDLALAIQHDTSQISALRAEASSGKATQKKIEMLNWLSKHEYSEQQHDYIRRYEDGTGVWILDHPNFKAWQAGMRDTLFCPGNPGTGKTMLSAMVVRHLIQTVRSADVAVVFLYCKYDQRQQQSAEQLIASLARQLVAMAAKVPDSVDEAFEKRDESRFISPTMQEMLLAAIKCFSRVYLVVDALDEGDELSIKELISTIRSLHKSGVKLLATSRFLPEIEAQFADDPWVEIRALDSDIEKYATSRLTELQRCVRNSTDLRAEVVQAIVTSTRGMFLLAKLKIDSLRDKRNVKAVKATLQKLPSGSDAYDPAYNLAMDRITGQSPGDHALAQKVLTWVVYAMRPLSVVDLETALAVELGELELDPDSITSVVDLLSLCAGLVIVEEQAKVVRLVHYTTQDYLSRNPGHLLNNPHRALSDVCVSYLGLDDFMAGGWADPAEDLVKQRYSHVEQYPFLSYAATHWEDHVERASPLDESKEAEQTISLNLRLFRHDELMESYFRAKGEWKFISWSEGSCDWFDFEQKTGLQYAAGRGMCKTVSALIEIDFNLDRAAYETTPLIEAVRGLHVPVVKLLLEAKVNVNMQGSVTHGTTALIEAAKKLHEPILILLLEAKANVNIRGSQWNTALASALLEHHGNSPVGVFKDTDSTVARARKSIVQLLLDAGSNPDHVPYRIYDKTVLMFAAKDGDEWAVTTLLNAGADPNLRDNQDMTALHFATQNGHESIVRVLLDHGGDPHLLTKYSETVLHLAARGGNGSMVRMLLDNGCDPHLQDSLSQTALFHAADNGHRLVVSMLLEHGCDENLQDYKSQTALSLAVKRGHVSIVKTLLDHGCDPDILDEQNTSPALWAATEGH